MAYKKLTDIRYIVVHCAATPASMDIGRKEIDLWHRQRGFLEIGYHSVIRRDGTIEAGRALDRPGAHALGFNEISLGVCLVGGVDVAGADSKPEANFTPAQMHALANQIDAWKQLPIVRPDVQIKGHRDLPSPHSRLKACPSFDVDKWLAAGRPLIPTV
jgi:N-acetylmuramoyl-L-alanine amidase